MDAGEVSWKSSIADLTPVNPLLRQREQLHLLASGLLKSS